MNEIKILEEKLNDLECLRKQMDVEEYIRQRSILTLKLESLKQRNNKKPDKSNHNFYII